VCGFMAGYLLWAGMVPSESQAVVVVEKMTERPVGTVGRRIVSAAAALPKPRARLSVVVENEQEPSGDD
ncbi:MAG: hypothetical protein OXN79_00225, partial [bacterium]|nr:hypothetical protein [bacterium]